MADKEKSGALAILIPKSKGGGPPPPSSDDEESGDSGELDPAYLAAAKDFRSIAADSEASDEDFASALEKAIKACESAGDY